MAREIIPFKLADGIKSLDRRFHKSSAFIFDDILSKDTPISINDHILEIVESKHDLKKLLETSAELKAKLNIPAAPLTMAAKVDYSSDKEEKNASSYLVVKVTNLCREESIKKLKLKKEIQNCSDIQELYDLYGNEYISTIYYGKELTAIVKLNSEDKKYASKIKQAFQLELPTQYVNAGINQTLTKEEKDEINNLRFQCDISMNGVNVFTNPISTFEEIKSKINEFDNQELNSETKGDALYYTSSSYLACIEAEKDKGFTNLIRKLDNKMEPILGIIKEIQKMIVNYEDLISKLLHKAQLNESDEIILELKKDVKLLEKDYAKIKANLKQIESIKIDEHKKSLSKYENKIDEIKTKLLSHLDLSDIVLNLYSNQKPRGGHIDKSSRGYHLDKSKLQDFQGEKLFWSVAGTDAKNVTFKVKAKIKRGLYRTIAKMDTSKIEKNYTDKNEILKYHKFAIFKPRFNDDTHKTSFNVILTKSMPTSVSQANVGDKRPATEDLNPRPLKQSKS